MTSKEIRRIKKTLDTLEAGFVKRAKALFDNMISEMQPYVEDALRIGNVDSFEMPGRKRYLVLFKRYLQELYAQGMTLADQELEAKRAKFDQHPSPAPVIPTGAMDWIDGWTTHFGDKYYGEATEDVVRVLKQGLAEGWSTEHTMTQLRVYLTDEKEYNKRRLEVIARTNATSAFNQGRLETFRQAGDFVQFVQFLAILDSRTTDICESRNGRLLRLDSPELAANTPPLHFQCRSILSPVTAYDLKDMEKPGWKDDQDRTLDELLDWRKVDPPSKGFGGDIQNRLPKTPGGPPPQIRGPERGQPSEPPKTLQLPTGKETGEQPVTSVLKEPGGGKLSKAPEGSNMGFEVSDEEIKNVVHKFDLLKEEHPDLITERIPEDALKKVAEYLADENLGRVEKYAWDKIAEGHIYSYACYLHEKIEIDLRLSEGEDHRKAHCEALIGQYSFLNEYIRNVSGNEKEYDILKLCCADSWDEDWGRSIHKDITNTKKLRNYLKTRIPKWYNEEGEFPTFNECTDVSRELRDIMNSLRQRGRLP
jgi:SPP1 gp7 family putative phage head morphogenesis protein